MTETSELSLPSAPLQSVSVQTYVHARAGIHLFQSGLCVAFSSLQLLEEGGWGWKEDGWREGGEKG